MSVKNLRIKHIDGLRGIAILVVVFFHAYSRWTNLIESQKESFLESFFQYGFYGVHLFFIISGFVIIMSLERSEKFFNFLYKRWLRIFPAMLAVSLLSRQNP